MAYYHNHFAFSLLSAAWVSREIQCSRFFNSFLPGPKKKQNSKIISHQVFTAQWKDIRLLQEKKIEPEKNISFYSN